MKAIPKGKTPLHRLLLRAILRLNTLGKSASVRLTHWTGKSRVPIHPKHLVPVEEEGHWYLQSLQPGMRVLDVGCGNGMHSIRAAGKGVIATGIDYNWKHLRAARVLSAERGITTTSFLLGSVAQPLPFQDSQFDVILFLDVIEHLHQRVAVLRELHRLLRPDGLLMVSAPNKETRWKQQLRAAGLPSFTDPDHKIEYAWDELRQELHEGGFTPITDPMPIVYDTPWAGLIDVVGGLSLPLYQRLGAWKTEMAQRFPADSSGWHVVCRLVPLP